MTHTVEELSNCLDKLSIRDQTFARSLVTQARNKGSLSTKQMYWVDKLVARILNPNPTVVTASTLPNMKTILNLLNQAKVHLKRPAIVFSDIKFGLAGERARVPGSVNVTNYKTKEWFGRILQDGSFMGTYSISMPEHVAVLMTKLAADPIAAASEYGRLSGRCCFCNLPLTDDRSTYVGYGPICAGHFGLPWGK